MKTTKIDYLAKIVSTILALSGIVGFLWSCDVMNPDADLLQPTVTIDGDEVFVLSNSSTFIDLTSKVKTNKPVRISITLQTKAGELADLGKGLLHYTPTAGTTQTKDSFGFTVFSERNEVIKEDTVEISIEKDSTHLPCAIFPVDDYVYGARSGTPLRIGVLLNDYICGADSTDLIITIYHPDDSFPPHAGRAEVTGQTVVYTPGEAFENADNIIYRIQSAAEPEKAVYGMIYVAGEQPCQLSVHDDIFAFERDSLSGTVFLPTFYNDSLCDSPVNMRVRISQPPRLGSATLTSEGFTYQLADTSTLSEYFTDYFLYEVCADAVCESARVEVKVNADSSVCVLAAIVDTLDISRNTISPIYFDVLYNDQVCEGYSTFTITQSPQYGTAYISGSTIAYERDPLMNKNDSLEYEICNEEKCSRAKAFIKRE